MTLMGSSSQPWAGPVGQINEALVRRAASDLLKPIYYVVGPPSMVEAMRGIVRNIGVNDDDIRSEEFYGY
jgi:ferredoxin-NADP reductase